MTIDELRVHLTHLIDTYVKDPAERASLQTFVGRDDVPVKYILAEITPSLSGVISPADAILLQDIVFNFC
ncbi:MULTISPECIES: hypothetical protein [Paraburkholderia]|uniref:hypothetical protein n=1 Tax=Paraburkholderia TaxID=1822464 RepID=UPI0022581A5A|nr:MULTISPECIES: hypothetical protein [Paraburkholderia]MCX4160655.1 hypothetical protein [Paraburkholderia megapolitana]MDN7156153.1 hypothetical protein [Paraburkholderia sp. CHISQ3]MDQ6493197.1 hypothetical protein [Paraburkholderia megapolitana]